tara:strand:- start:699 stop:1022 length:324 start_codon:yes stop_codon:yes gene_type:complete
MIRKGMVRAIKPEYVKEYKKTHSDVWPEILEKITNCKIKNYSVFANEDKLFSFFEYHGQNFETDTKKMRDNKKFEEWEKFHEHMFKPLENKTKDEGWVELEEIFRKD